MSCMNMTINPDQLNIGDLDDEMLDPSELEGYFLKKLEAGASFRDLVELTLSLNKISPKGASVRKRALFTANRKNGNRLLEPHRQVRASRAEAAEKILRLLGKQ